MPLVAARFPHMYRTLSDRYICVVLSSHSPGWSENILHLLCLQQTHIPHRVYIQSLTLWTFNPIVNFFFKVPRDNPHCWDHPQSASWRRSVSLCSDPLSSLSVVSLWFKDVLWHGKLEIWRRGPTLLLGHVRGVQQCRGPEAGEC